MILIGTIVLVFVFIGIFVWIWQIFDAHDLAEKINRGEA